MQAEEGLRLMQWLEANKDALLVIAAFIAAIAAIAAASITAYNQQKMRKLTHIDNWLTDFRNLVAELAAEASEYKFNRNNQTDEMRAQLASTIYKIIIMLDNSDKDEKDFSQKLKQYIKPGKDGGYKTESPGAIADAANQIFIKYRKTLR
jgi:hypothetical protein